MKKLPIGKIIFGLSVLAVITVIIIGIIIIEAPQKMRHRQIDSDTVRELRMICNSIDRYWRVHKTLPPDLETIIREIRIGDFRIDPFAHVTAYTFVDSTTYILCSTFLTDSFEPNGFTPPPGYPRTIDWRHTEGEYCYTVEVRDETIGGH